MGDVLLFYVKRGDSNKQKQQGVFCKGRIYPFTKYT